MSISSAIYTFWAWEAGEKRLSVLGTQHYFTREVMQQLMKDISYLYTFSVIYMKNSMPGV